MFYNSSLPTTNLVEMSLSLSLAEGLSVLSKPNQNKTSSLFCCFVGLLLVFVVVVFHFVHFCPGLNYFFLSIDLRFGLFLFSQDPRVYSYYLRTLRLFFFNKGT